MIDQQEILNKEEVLKMLSEGQLQTQTDVGKLIKELTGQVLETILKGELDAHLGYKKYDQKNKKTTNSRNGTSSKRVKTQVGELPLKIPRDRDNEFEPALIKKGDRELAFFEDHILALYAKGMSTRDITGIIKELYDYEISAETVSMITARVREESATWHSRPLEPLYTVVFLDGFFTKVRVEGSVRKVCVYVIIGIKVDGTKDCLGFWIEGQGESSLYWLNVLNEIKNRGVENILIFCVDNLSGISEAISASFPKAEIQKCVVHQIRNSLKYVSYKDRKEVSEDLKTIYKASTESEGRIALEKFDEKWGSKYPHIGKSWRNNWSELSAYFKYSPEIRRLIYTTNPIESVNRGIRKRVKTRSVFPSKESLGKVVFLAIDEMSQKWTNPIPNWGLILSQLRIYFKHILEPYLEERI
jgi:transposase-like protein